MFDTFRWSGYFTPTALTGANTTNARWISPGTVDPSSGDIPGVPYPADVGQSRGTVDGSVFMLNQPIAVGNNIDLSSVKLNGRFAFDNSGWSVFAQLQGQTGGYLNANGLPDGYGAFTPANPPVSGLATGLNSIGLVLDGGEANNTCAGGGCAMGAIADFYVEATCNGLAPDAGSLLPASAKAVPTLDIAGLGLLGLLSAGAGALALRRRKQAK